MCIGSKLSNYGTYLIHGTFQWRTQQWMRFEGRWVQVSVLGECGGGVISAQWYWLLQETLISALGFGQAVYKYKSVIQKPIAICCDEWKITINSQWSLGLSAVIVFIQKRKLDAVNHVPQLFTHSIKWVMLLVPYYSSQFSMAKASRPTCTFDLCEKTFS